MEPQNINTIPEKNSNIKNLILKIIIIILLIIVVFLLINIKNNQHKPAENNNENQTQQNDKENNNNIDKPIKEKEDKFIVEYEEETYETKNNKGIITTKNKKTIVKITNEKYPEIAKQIEKSVNTKINDEWQNSIISSANELNKEINEGDMAIFKENDYDGLGAHIIASNIELTSNIITFYTELSGSFGGVGWFEYKGYNYDKKTGELLTLKTITNDYSGLYKVIKQEIDKKINELKKDESASFTYENEKQLEELANKTGNWMFTDKGIDIIYQEYEIADGATGAITISIDKNLINEKLKETYKF